MPGVSTTTVGSPSSPSARRSQRQAQVVGVVLHRRDPVAGEQLGEHAHHRLPVLQHVGDAGRRAALSSSTKNSFSPGAHHVDADDVGIDAARRLHAHHLRHEGLVLDDQVFRDAAGLDDLLAMVDVVHEGVERAHALLDAGGEAAPFRRAQDARDDVEGNEALGGAVVAVDGEGDAGAAKQRSASSRLRSSCSRGVARSQRSISA